MGWLHLEIANSRWQMAKGNAEFPTGVMLVGDFDRSIKSAQAVLDWPGDVGLLRDQAQELVVVGDG